MARIIVNNPRQVINGGAKKYYFKVKGLGGPKGDKGDKGDTGSQGPQGPQGNAATISVGSTTTLPVGYNATVENVGSIYNAVLNFGIPQGPRGPQGATGAKGDKGDKGEQGNPGPQGEKGTNATVTVGTTTTTEPGTRAYAWNSSSNPNNAVINFNIPRGATGSQGPRGVQGPTGPAGESFTPVVVSSLPATGEEGKLYLTPKNYTTVTATGNPITATVAEEAGKIESLKLDGDTYQQTYTGKNLASIDNTSVTTGTVTSTVSNHTHFEVSAGTPDSWGFNLVGQRQRIKPIPAGTYTLSLTSALPFATNFQLRATSSGSSLIGTVDIPAGATSVTFTLSESASFMTFWSTASSASAVSFDIQIEAGSTATDFEPYVGGTPSPNPEYPQPIQTVTGMQTVTINGTDYPLDLGSIELCKLGTYQDYIYKDGDDWKVHKALNKTTLNGSEAWYSAGGNAPFGLVIDGALITTSDGNPPLVYCDKFYPVPQSASWSAYDSLISSNNINSSTKTIRIRYTSIASLADFKTWLAGHNTILYYVLATATDTTITDTALIAQLEAIRTASLQNGANTITNTATGSNLAGDMEIGYYGFNPRNRYDKWLWLDINNEYEQIGS